MTDPAAIAHAAKDIAFEHIAWARQSGLSPDDVMKSVGVPPLIGRRMTWTRAYAAVTFAAACMAGMGRLAKSKRVDE